MRAMLDEVVGPDLVRPLRPQGRREPSLSQAWPFRLMSRNLEPFTAPDPFDPLHGHRPTFTTEQGGDKVRNNSDETRLDVTPK